jgi:cytosine/adenosine deaminase-related metal-dependent hydrolase
VIGLGDYGIAVGREASFVALHAPNAAAVATVPYERIVVRKGEIFAAPGACKNS